jgi:R67 dihydrofolate reductase
MKESRFAIGDRVRKHSGAWWEGKVVGFYGTDQTERGYNVQLDMVPNGPVQIYPEAALEPAPNPTPVPIVSAWDCCPYCGGSGHYGDATQRAINGDIPMPIPIVSVPEGWALVPIEATEAMVKAGEKWSGLPSQTWTDMLDAAPISESEGTDGIPLEAYRDELLKIAADLGEPDDPFAAWESVGAMKEELRIRRLEAGHDVQDVTDKVNLLNAEDRIQELENKVRKLCRACEVALACFTEGIDSDCWEGVDPAEVLREAIGDEISHVDFGFGD